MGFNRARPMLPCILGDEGPGCLGEGGQQRSETSNSALCEQGVEVQLRLAASLLHATRDAQKVGRAGLATASASFDCLPAGMCPTMRLEVHVLSTAGCLQSMGYGGRGLYTRNEECGERLQPSLPSWEAAAVHCARGLFTEAQHCGQDQGLRAVCACVETQLKRRRMTLWLVQCCECLRDSASMCGAGDNLSRYSGRCLGSVQVCWAMGRSS